MRKVSATIITRDEEAKVERALASLAGVADQILVVDSLSRDSTVEICRRHADRVIERAWLGYRAQKQFAAEQAAFDWVLSLDADEVLGPDLREQLKAWKQLPADDPRAGYRVRRRTRFLGRWIDHTSWASDWQLRLFDRRRASWQGGRVHESVRAAGEVGRLEGVLEHYTYESVSEYLAQLENFSRLAAADAFERGRRCSWARLLLLPPWEFGRNFLLARGFLDGVPGLAVSVLCAVSVFFKQLKLYELQQGLAPPPEEG